MSRFDYWATRDGRTIKVSEMESLHLLHTIRAIEQGRLFPGANLCFGIAARLTDEAADVAVDAAQEERDGWLSALRAEAERRRLNHTIPPTSRVGLVKFVTSFAAFMDGLSTSQALDIASTVAEAMEFFGLKDPEIDVVVHPQLPNRVSYLHYQTGDGVGTPMEDK